ncbi:hypothetical protein BJV82DRAFT_604758 [Fennellomyces sp. T-0311]|nr:hypothetical protein BJV82DRAFT_604758 [Fennellomyces sp. T-0311]
MHIRGSSINIEPNRHIEQLDYSFSSKHTLSHIIAGISSASALFTPIKVGNTQLEHRVGLAPLKFFRSDEKSVTTTLQQ